jgi:hypothetical protein
MKITVYLNIFILFLFSSCSEWYNHSFNKKTKVKTSLLGIFLIINSGCSPIEGNFKSKELVSTKGEQVYINTLNW